MVDGRLAKLANEQALLEQAFIKDTSKTVGDVIKEAIAAIGENIQVRPCNILWSKQKACVSDVCRAVFLQG